VTGHKIKNISIGVIIAGLFLGLMIGSASAWWNSSWSKRVPIHINNTGNSNALTDYQVMINITYNSDMNSNFSDIRVVNETSGTAIPYWIENKSNGNWCKIWFNASYIPASSWYNDTYYLYYGNPSASSASDGDATFKKFYSFEDNYIGWTWVTDLNNEVVKIGNKILISYHSPDLGDNGILIYDISNQSWNRKVIFSDNEKGDHYPAVLLETTNYILVFIPHRPGTVATIHAYRYDYNLNFIDSVQLTDYDSAFPQVVQLNNGRIYCFWRDDSTPDAPVWKYRYSDDEGATWSDEIRLTTGPAYGTLSYLHAATDGEKVYVSYHEMGGEPDLAYGVWFMYLDTDGQWKKDDGTVITLPANPDDMSKPVDKNACAWQILYYNGKVHIYYHDEADTNDFKYYQLIWGGSAWTDQYICDSNRGGLPKAPHLALGISAKQDNPDIVYASVDVNGVAEIQKWVYDGTWTKTEDITQNSAKDNWRPVAVRGGSNFDVVWQVVVGYWNAWNDIKDIYLGARGIYPYSVIEWEKADDIIFENNKLKIPAGNDNANYLNSTYTNTTLNPQGTALEMKTKISGATSGDFWNVGWRQDANTVYISRHSYSTTRDWDLLIKGVDAGTGYGEASGYNDVYAQDEWHRFSLRVRENTLKLVDVNNPANELSSTDAFFGQITSANIGLGRWADYGTFYVDYIFVRKYADPEPIAELGSEPFYNVSGYVKTSGGTAIENAYVTNNVTSDTDYTNSSGYYNLSLPNGTYLIKAEKLGYASNTSTVTVSGADVSNVNITLENADTTFTVTLPAGYTYAHFNLTGIEGASTKTNWAPEGQSDTQPFYNVTNTGNVNLSIRMQLNATIPNVILKVDTDNNPSGAKEVNTTLVEIYSDLPPDSSINIWLWTDLSHAEEQETGKNLTINVTQVL